MNKRPDKKPLVIYHGNCADSFAAAWCFWHKYKEDYEYYPGVYGLEPPDVTGRKVFLVDFSYPRETIVNMVLKASQVVLIDHHETAIKNLYNIPGLYTRLDINKSGAILAWEFVHEDEPPPILLGYIQDQDLWRFKLERSRPINAYVFSCPYEFEVWEKLMTLKSSELLGISVSGAAILRKHEKDLEELLRFSRRTMVIDEYTVPVANLPYTMASDAGAALADFQLFGATYIDTHEHRVFSLRSRQDQPQSINVATVASKYGGSGHKHASGFKVLRDHALAQS